MKRVFILALFICAVTCFFLTACLEEKRRPSRYLFPDGYVGWVRIDYNVKDAPALPTEDGFYLLKFPPNGHLQTSTPLEFGSATDEYFYYSSAGRKPIESTGWGQGGLIWGGHTGRINDNPERHEGMFIGTEEQFKTFGANHKDEHLRPKIGPIQ